MSEFTRRLLTSWELQPVLLFYLIGFGILYTIGWVRLRRNSSRLASLWRLNAYWGGITFVIIALMSPIEVLAAELFFMHMIQHLFLNMFGAPLIMLANPMPFVLWGLPTSGRRAVGRVLSKVLHRQSGFREWLRWATRPAITWMIMVSVLWIWHDGDLYSLALTNDFVHDLEHLTFFFSSALYWWLVTGAGPRVHKIMSLPARIGYLLAGIPATFILGVAIAFSTNVIYTYYETRPRIFPNISVIDDQTIGGILMWVVGSMMYLVAALVVIGIWMSENERRTPLPSEPAVPEGVPANQG